jgi:hypothetical protein
MRKKLILLVFVTLVFAGSGLFMFWPFFDRVPTRERVAPQIKETEEAHLRRKADEDSQLAATGSLPNLTVPEIVRTPARYDKRLVRLRGCVFMGFEISSLVDCERPRANYGEVIWLTTIDQILNDERMLKEPSLQEILGHEMILNQKQHWRDPLPETESQVALRKQILGPRIVLARVVVDGEFQSSRGAYGHSGAYKYQLILHRFIQASTQTRDKNTGPQR